MIARSLRAGPDAGPQVPRRERPTSVVGVVTRLGRLSRPGEHASRERTALPGTSGPTRAGLRRFSRPRPSPTWQAGSGMGILRRATMGAVPVGHDLRMVTGASGTDGST